MASGVAVTDTLLVNDVGVVALGRADQIGDDAELEIIAGATFRMNGFNDTIGSLYLNNVSADALPSTLDPGGATLTLNGDITADCDNNNLTPTIKGRLSLPVGSHLITTFGSAYAGLDMQAQITGSGGFTKSGTSALLLEASNTFFGDILIVQGILDVRNDSALGDISGDTSLYAGSLTLRNVAIGAERLNAEGQAIGGDFPGSLLTSIGTCSWAGQVVLDDDLVVAGDMTFTDDISGPGGIGFFGGGTSQLGGSPGNTYTGTTLVRCPLLEFNKPSGIQAYAGPLVVGGGFGGTGGAVAGPVSERWGDAHPLRQWVGEPEQFQRGFRGGDVQWRGGGQRFGRPVRDLPAADRQPGGDERGDQRHLGLPAGGSPPSLNAVFIVGDGAADCDLVVNATVFGTPEYFVKQGAGTMCLTGANTYNAVTLLEAGILDVNNGSALGTDAGLVIFNGATLRLEGGGNFSGGFEVVGAGVGGTHGAVEALPNSSFTFAGGVLLDAATTLNIGVSAGLG